MFDRNRFLRDMHRVYFLNERVYDEELKKVLRFEPPEYHLGMVRLYERRMNANV